MTRVGCDQIILPVLDALRTCAARQFGLCHRPVTEFYRFYGDHPMPADSCDCKPGPEQGTAWVRWVGNRGDDPEMPGDCAGGAFTAVFEIGVHRCAPSPQGRIPVPARTWDRFTAGMLDDVAALRRAPKCCDFFADNDLRWTTQHTVPLGPAGGCASAVTQISVRFSECGCPDTSEIPVDPEATWKTAARWHGGYSGEFTIVNGGLAELVPWQLDFQLPASAHDIEIWPREHYRLRDLGEGKYRITSARPIAAGGQAVIGARAEMPDEDVAPPTNLRVQEGGQR